MKRILLLFIDGLGVAPAGENNPITQERYPTLYNILNSAAPIDATLHHPGTPQSATGQTAILTGINAANAVGRHVEGFPGPVLQKIITENNLLLKLHNSGKEVTFANAYTMDTFEAVAEYRFRSVTTTCVMSCPSALRLFCKLKEDNAVYQDITRELLIQRGLDIPLITPRDASDHLSRIVDSNDLTLFEYFQSDRAGHRGTTDNIGYVLATLEEFCCHLLPSLAAIDATIIITSDHGNIEDLSVHTHTMNPVPCFRKGPLAGALGSIDSITEITPAIIKACNA